MGDTGYELRVLSRRFACLQCSRSEPAHAVTLYCLNGSGYDGELIRVIPLQEQVFRTWTSNGARSNSIPFTGLAFDPVRSLLGFDGRQSSADRCSSRSK